jgi:hypothetical protein
MAYIVCFLYTVTFDVVDRVVVALFTQLLYAFTMLFVLLQGDGWAFHAIREKLEAVLYSSGAIYYSSPTR